MFRAAAEDAGVEPGVARAVCPRGAVDLALAYHEAGDAAMLAALDAADLSEMKFRDRVAFAVRARLEAVEDTVCVEAPTDHGANVFVTLEDSASNLVLGRVRIGWVTAEQKLHRASRREIFVFLRRNQRKKGFLGWLAVVTILGSDLGMAGRHGRIWFGVEKQTLWFDIKMHYAIC